MWKALEDLINGNDDATGRLILETEETDDGEQRYIRVLTRKEILHKFASLPVVHLDATMPFDLVKHFLPDLTSRSRRGSTAYADHPGRRAAGWQIITCAQAAGQAKGQDQGHMDGDAGGSGSPRHPPAARPG
jgi:hypothetical protein